MQQHSPPNPAQTPPSKQVVGVFDSGVGGLSVLRAIAQALPSAHCVYIADSGYAPYGGRSADYVLQRCNAMVDALLAKGVSAIVVACNTATVLTVDMLRQRCDLPIIAIEPAIKPAALATRTGVVGVLATEQTIASSSVARLCEQWGEHAKFVLQACPGVVDLVEAGQSHSPAMQTLLTQYLAPIMAANADTVVLGCTHYPFLLPQLQQIAGGKVRFIDPAAAVARELVRRLDSVAPPSTQFDNVSFSCDFYTTGDVALAQTVMVSLWGEPLKVHAL